MDDVMRQLKDLRNVTPRKEWVETNRAILLSQIRGQEGKTIEDVAGVRYMDLLKVIFGYKILAPIVRPVSIAVLAIIVVLTGGVVGVRAAKDSAPGDLLYPIKLTSENLQVGLTTAPEKKVELYLSFAEERVKEIQQVKTMANGSRAAKIGDAAQNLKENLQKANAQLAVVKVDAPDKAVDLAKTVSEKAAAISGKLAEVGKDLKVNNESVEAVSLAQTAARSTEIGAVEVIIEKQAAGDTKVESAELKTIVEEKIDSLTQDIKETKDSMDNAVEVIIAEQKLQEADKLLNEGDVGSAVDKMKEVVH
jgi:hypothetical protein